MELQAVSPVLAEALRTVGTIDAASAVVKEVRSESPRLAVGRPRTMAIVEEIIVPDQRAGVTPAQSVERKLSAMLRAGSAIPVSHFRLAKLCRKS
jgi:hypothetical protein